MTDTEADDWFTEYAECTMEHGTGMLSFQLWRKGQRAEDQLRLGFRPISNGLAGHALLVEGGLLTDPPPPRTTHAQLRHPGSLVQ